jgi:hypothetical protein
MTLSTLLTDTTTYTQTDLDLIVREQLERGQFSQADSLRTAVMYSPLIMTPGEWVAACKANAVRANTARNRFSEIRRQQRADGELS